MAVVVVTGCTGSPATPVASTALAPASPAASSAVELVIDGLSAPTQFIKLVGNGLLIAQLNGDENASLGQVLVADSVTKKQRVLIDQLDKPTGVAYINGAIWVMVRRGLVKAAWDGQAAKAGPIDVVLADLPFNGRSEGGLTPLPDGRLLYETSGNEGDGTPEPKSGVLWAYDPATKTSMPIATGLKNAYAHVVLQDGRVITTEISGDNSNPPPDAINIIPVSSPNPPNFGWPTCRADSTDAVVCSGVTRPLLTLPKNSTPTGVAVIGTSAYVALWVTGEIYRFDLSAAKPTATVVMSGLNNPHTLVPEADGRLLLSDGDDRIVRIKP
jgi:glucose/arabinose dehydrogenase